VAKNNKRLLEIRTKKIVLSHMTLTSIKYLLIDTARGRASTCAFGNQRCNGNIGILT